MADARIGRIALVVVGQAFQWMAEIDGVVIAVLRLQLCDAVAVFGHLVRMRRFGAAVMRIHFGAQQGAPQCAVGFVRRLAGLDFVLVERHGLVVSLVELFAKLVRQLSVIERIGR